MTDRKTASPRGSSTDRVAALRRSSGRPAQSAKIITAGLGTSMMLGIVSYMGHSANLTAQAKAAAQAAAAPVLPGATDAVPASAVGGVTPSPAAGLAPSGLPAITVPTPAQPPVVAPGSAPAAAGAPASPKPAATGTPSASSPAAAAPPAAAPAPQPIAVPVPVAAPAPAPAPAPTPAAGGSSQSAP